MVPALPGRRRRAVCGGVAAATLARFAGRPQCRRPTAQSGGRWRAKPHLQPRRGPPGDRLCRNRGRGVENRRRGGGTARGRPALRGHRRRGVVARLPLVGRYSGPKPRRSNRRPRARHPRRRRPASRAGFRPETFARSWRPSTACMRRPPPARPRSASPISGLGAAPLVRPFVGSARHRVGGGTVTAGPRRRRREVWNPPRVSVAGDERQLGAQFPPRWDSHLPPWGEKSGRHRKARSLDCPARAFSIRPAFSTVPTGDFACRRCRRSASGWRSFSWCCTFATRLAANGGGAPTGGGRGSRDARCARGGGRAGESPPRALVPHRSQHRRRLRCLLGGGAPDRRASGHHGGAHGLGRHRPPVRSASSPCRAPRRSGPSASPSASGSSSASRWRLWQPWPRRRRWHEEDQRPARSSGSLARGSGCRHGAPAAPRLAKPAPPSPPTSRPPTAIPGALPCAQEADSRSPQGGGG